MILTCPSSTLRVLKAKNYKCYAGCSGKPSPSSLHWNAGQALTHFTTLSKWKFIIFWRVCVQHEILYAAVDIFAYVYATPCATSKQRLSGTCKRMIDQHHTVTSAPLCTHQKTESGEGRTFSLACLAPIGRNFNVNLTPRISLAVQKQTLTPRSVTLAVGVSRIFFSQELRHAMKMQREEGFNPGFPGRFYSSNMITPWLGFETKTILTDMTFGACNNTKILYGRIVWLSLGLLGMIITEPVRSCHAKEASHCIGIVWSQNLVSLTSMAVQFMEQQQAITFHFLNF